MDVHLTPDHEAFIQSNVESGRFQSAEDAVREAIELLARRESHTALTREFVQEGIAGIDNGEFEDFTDDNLHTLFEGIGSRGRERVQQQH